MEEGGLWIMEEGGLKVPDIDADEFRRLIDLSPARKPRRRKASTPESAVLTACLDWLTLRGVYHWRHFNAGVYDPVHKVHRKPPKGWKPGVADIIGILPDGRLLAVEIKRPDSGKLSKTQAAFLDAVNRLGGLALCVRGVDELERALEGEA